MFDLTGRHALVTGGASGIGEQVCRAMAAQGAKVTVADIHEVGAMRVAAELGDAGVARALDVTQSSSCQAAVAASVEKWGVLDVLVNCAGIGWVGSIEETEAADMERLWSVNVMGVYQMSRAALPHLLASGCGAIVNIGSVAGLVGVRRRFAYCATKGAVIAMTRQMALDYAGTGLRVNCIAPGTVETPFVESYLSKFHRGEEDRVRKELHARQPIGRMGRPEEIAALAVYLASSDSSFMTGSVIAIDGGWTAQ
jgi:NAD(P)-dependent dehydrogenase (short-subunit alcohol dehydrogenase family)